MSGWLASHVWHYKADHITQVILMALCDSAEDDGTSCYPSVRYVMWKTSTGRSTVYATINALQQRGVLELVGFKGDTPEFVIHLDRMTPKPAFERVRRGRPRKKPSTTETNFPDMEYFPPQGNLSTTEQNIPPQGKTVHHREKLSMSGTAKRRSDTPRSEKRSGVESRRVVAERTLGTNLIEREYTNGDVPSPQQDKNPVPTLPEPARATRRDDLWRRVVDSLRWRNNATKRTITEGTRLYEPAHGCFLALARSTFQARTLAEQYTAELTAQIRFITRDMSAELAIARRQDDHPVAGDN